MRDLPDTTAISDLVRNPRGKCAARIAEADENNAFTSMIVTAELRYGARRRNSAKLSRQLEAVLAADTLQTRNRHLHKIPDNLRSSSEGR